MNPINFQRASVPDKAIIHLVGHYFGAAACWTDALASLPGVVERLVGGPSNRTAWEPAARALGGWLLDQAEDALAAGRVARIQWASPLALGYNTSWYAIGSTGVTGVFHVAGDRVSLATGYFPFLAREEPPPDRRAAASADVFVRPYLDGPSRSFRAGTSVPVTARGVEGALTFPDPEGFGFSKAGDDWVWRPTPPGQPSRPTFRLTRRRR